MSLALRPSAKSLGQNAHRTKPRSPALHTPNARARVVRTLALTLLASCCLPLGAWAAPGSGTASIVPTAPVLAGATGTWTIRYVAAEDFAPAQGGWVYAQIPPGWTAPQVSQPSQPGYVTIVDTASVSEAVIAGNTIELRLGGAPKGPFLTGDTLSVIYGAGAAQAQVQPTGPDVAVFWISSDAAGSSVAPIAASPAVDVYGPLDHVRIENGAGVEVGGLSLDADQDTTTFHLHGYDAAEHSLGPQSGAWSVTGGIGSVPAGPASSAVLTVTTAGAGRVVAASGAIVDSTGVITVSHGAPSSIEASFAPAAPAGSGVAASVRVRDQDGNTVTTGPLAGASVSVLSFAAASGPATSDPDFVASQVALLAGAWSGTLTPRHKGSYWLSALHAGSGFESTPRAPLSVSAGPADHVVLTPSTLALVAGGPDTVSIVTYDAFGNRAPLATAETLTLWTDRPGGHFAAVGGGTIFEVTVPAAADSARFVFTDVTSGGGTGHVRAIDANGSGASLGTAEASVTTIAAVPFGNIALSALPAALVANGIDSTSITSGAVRDAYGNVVASGTKVTLSGSGLTPLGDQDAGTPGVQWLTGVTGMLQGWARAGTAAGAGSLSLVSVQGSATGSIPVPLAPGVPAGAIALLASPDSVAADSVAVRGVTASALEDAFGNTVVNGERYTVATTLGSIIATDRDSTTAGVQVEASGGSISFSLLGGATLGTASVTATSVRGSASGSIPIRIVPGPVSASRSSVAAVSPATVGPAGSTVTLTLRDARDHALPLVPASSIALSWSGPPGVSFSALGAGTGASGSIDFRTFTTLTMAGTVHATVSGVPLLMAPAISFMAGSPDTLVVTGPAGPLMAGSSQALDVRARDAYGNDTPAAAGFFVRPIVLTGAAQVPDSAAVSGGTGTVPFTPIAAGPLSIRIADDFGHATTYGPVTVTSGPAYRLVAAPPAAPSVAAGDSTAIHATVLDSLGNAVAGASVSASIVTGAGLVAPASDLTDASGVADFTLHAGGSLGPLRARLSVPASAAPDSVRADSVLVTVVPAATASLEVVADSLQWTAGVPVRVRVRARDAFGNLVVGDGAIVGMTPSGSVQWTPSSGSLAAGEFVTFGRDTVAETISLAASQVGGGSGSGGTAVVQPAPAATVALVLGNAQTAVVDHEVALPLQVRARDAFGNNAPGTPVVFAVTSGGGSVDAVRGGAADSVAVAGAGGVASCEVFRLGTTAGAGNQGVVARLAALPAAQVAFTATALPDTAASLALAPASLSLAADATANVQATARDRWGNLVPTASVTFFLGAPARGTLESTGETSGGPGSQTGVTDASGVLHVRYHAPGSAPAADSIFARGVSVAPVGIRAVTGASSVASLSVIPDSTNWVAGDSVRVLVRALDAFGNLVSTDTAVITMQSSGSVLWIPASGSMTAGQFVTRGKATIAQTVSISATRAGGGVGSAGPIAIRPAAPSGTIAVTATRDTLTADGRSTATVTLGPLADAFGNLVPAGTLVGVTAGAALLGPDASGAPGLQLATALDGRASAILTAPNAPGIDTLRAASVAGSAAGSRGFTYLPKPSVSYAAGSLAPSVVTPGSAWTPVLRLTHGGTGTVTLGAGTTLSFGTGPTAVSVAIATPHSLGPGATDTLRFATTSIPAALLPGTYAPALRLLGTDATGEPLDFYPSLAGAQTHVAGVDVAAVGAVPASVPLGYTDLGLVFDVHNPTALAASLDGVAVGFSVGAFQTGATTPALPTPLPAGGTVRIRVSVQVPASGIAAGTPVTATLTATAGFPGASVTAPSATPVSFTVESAAQVIAVTSGLAPSHLLRGRTAGPTVRVRNMGTTGVTLDRALTRLELDHPGGGSLATGLSAVTALAAGDTATLAFDSLTVASSDPHGPYAARLVLAGSESGQAFADTIALDPDSVAVLDPAILSVTAMAPDTVSAGQSRPVTLTVANTGDVAFQADAQTTLRIGSPLSTTLAISGAATIAPGATSSLVFSAAPLGAAPGAASATLEARGLEDGRARDESIAAGTLVALPKAQLRYVAGSTNPDTVRAGDTHDLTLSLANDGGSPLLVNPAASRLLVSDGVESAIALGAGAPFTLGPGTTAVLSFPGTAFPLALASQPYPVSLVVKGSEWGLADSATVASPMGEVVVAEPAAAVQVRGLDAGAPVQAAPGVQDVRLLGLEMTPLVGGAGGVASAHLTTLRVRVLTDGSEAESPSTSVSSIVLRGAAGALLAQATPGSANPVVLALNPPLPLGQGAESLYVEISVPQGTGAHSVALRVAVPPDIVVLDDLTGTTSPIRGGGGLAFQPIASPALTLFVAAHGYPNPFHAGRENVKLSYKLADDASVKVTIYTLLGARVRDLTLAAGTPGGTRGLNEVAWDGRNGNGDLVLPGVYVARIEGGGAAEQIKVGVLR